MTKNGEAQKGTTAWAAAIIVLAGLAAYANSFSGPFIFDDRPSVADNPSIRHLWPLWGILSPPVKAGVGGRPMLNLAYAFGYALSGMQVWGYHLVDLVVHLLTALALFGILKRTLAGNGESRGGRADALALAVTVIWTVHPLQTEAVTYISELAESLMGMFYLLTLYCFIRSADATAGARPSSLWGAGSIAACLLGMATKEVTVTVPVMALLYDRTFLAGSFREAWRRRWRLYLGLGGTWLLVAYLMHRTNVRGQGVGLDLGGSWWAYALMECRVIVRYLGLALWPHPLIFDYGIGVPRPNWGLLPYVAILVALVAATGYALFRRGAPEKEGLGWRSVGFCGAWVFLILAPTSSVVAVAGQPMAEHRMYLPLAGVLALVVCGGYGLLGRPGLFRPWLLALSAVAVLCGYLTFRRNEVYRSEVAIWSDTVAKLPTNVRAQNGLGLALAGAGDFSGAIARYREALRLKPDYPDAHQNLGAALKQAGRLSEAVAQCEEDVRLRPENPVSHNNLGIVLQADGRIDAAIDQFTQALKLNPDYADAHYNLGLALIDARRLSEAVVHFQQTVRLRPDFPEAHFALGTLLAGDGHLAEALTDLEETVRLNPGFAAAHYNLAVVLQGLGRKQEAAAEFGRARQMGFTP